MSNSKFKVKAASQLDNWIGGQFYAELVTTTWTPGAGDTQRQHISANICTSTGYASQNITNKTRINDPHGDYDCDDIDFTSNGVNEMTARYIVIIKGDNASKNTTDPICGYIDLNDGVNQNVTITGAHVIPTTGIIDNTFAADSLAA